MGISQPPKFRGRYNGHTHRTYDAGVSIRRNWDIPDTLLL